MNDFICVTGVTSQGKGEAVSHQQLVADDAKWCWAEYQVGPASGTDINNLSSKDRVGKRQILDTWAKMK